MISDSEFIKKAVAKKLKEIQKQEKREAKERRKKLRDEVKRGKVE